MSRRQPPARTDFGRWRTITLRWADNDAYGHVNNTVYYAWFDSAVNAMLVEEGLLDIDVGDPIALVVGTSCDYFAPLSFPGEVDVGLAADIGTLARLPKIAGNHSLVHELAYTAREFGADEAARMGLVSRVVPGGRDEVLAAALETAGVIARKSPIAVVGTKRVLLHARDHS